MLKEKITDRLKTFFEGSDRFLVDVRVSPQEKITVFVDGRMNISIGECVEISRMLEEYLETEHLVRENYTLEVSSPGMGEPFKVREQYEKSLGRGLEVVQNDGIRVEGVLESLEEDLIIIRVEKKLKNRITGSELVTIPMDEIKVTKQLITFK